MSNNELTKQQVLDALRTVDDPELHRDLVSLGMIRDVQIDGSKVSFTLVLTTMACPMKAKIQEDARQAVTKLSGVENVTINLTAETPKRPAPAQGSQVVLQDLIPSVKNAIAVASGKGGVGKSTVATNLALALAREGSSVGLLDADVYGPSIPTMMGISESPSVTQDEKIIPITKHGIELMSIGFMIPEKQSVVWRGPMVAKLLQQFLDGVEWGDLDYLIIDLPPGTGDAQLTITQSVPLAGGVIVSTPQAVALADVRRAVTMFEKVDVPVLGVIENMSVYVCPKCGHESHIFAHGGAKSEAENQGVPFLGEIPIDLAIREAGDAGEPVLARDPDSAVAKAFGTIARDVAGRISVRNVEARRQARAGAGGSQGLPMYEA